MILKKTLFIILSIIFLSCQKAKTKKIQNLGGTVNYEMSHFVNELKLPDSLSMIPFFFEGSFINTHEARSVAKGMHDCLIYFPINNSSHHGILFVSHESTGQNSTLGNGGGGSLIEVKFENGRWHEIMAEAVDYSEVGQTLRNCGGKATNNGTILSCEEIYPTNNKDLYRVFPDTSDLFNKPAYKNFGYVVEIDPVKKKAIRKIKGMGRFEHEDVLPLSDGKTFFLTQDASPAIFYKYQTVNGNLSFGQLYALKLDNKMNGTWIPLPRNEDSLEIASTIAKRKGATLFNRHEWMTLVNGKIYITETGKDNFNWGNDINDGGVPAPYFSNLKISENKYSDPYGRILEFDILDNSMKVFFECGKNPESNLVLSNPDCITNVKFNGQEYLVINEDIIGTNKGRNGVFLEDDEIRNEIYMIPIKEKASWHDVSRLMVAPKGSETTGGIFTPNQKTYFVSIQHPSKNNKKPFNKSCILAITGF